MPLVCLKPRRGTAVPKDPFKAHVSFLLHADSTPFVDIAGGRTMSVNGSVTLSNTGYFSKSMLFSGTSCLQYGDITGFGLDAMTSFTAEAFVAPDAVRQQSIMSTRNDASTGWDIRIESTGAISFYLTGGGAAALLTSTPNINFGVWNHVAVVKDNGVVSIYINGVNNGSKTISTRAQPTGTVFRLGAISDSGLLIPFRGLMDEVRITPDVARYTSNFAVPTQPFPYV